MLWMFAASGQLSGEAQNLIFVRFCALLVVPGCGLILALHTCSEFKGFLRLSTLRCYTSYISRHT